MAGIQWSDKEKEMLKKLSDAHCTADDACRVFPSRSRQSIFSQARNMKISLSGPTPEINMAEFKKLIGGK